MGSINAGLFIALDGVIEADYGDWPTPTRPTR